MATQAMDVDKDNDAKEIKLSPPKQFDGDRNKFRKFLQDAELYMTINQKIYKDDLTKIGFVLSFMKEGQAAAWADQFVEHAMSQPKPATGLLNLGTYTAFRKDLSEAFAAFDTPGDALDQMKNLRMKNDDSADEHIAKFKTLLAESRLDENSAAVIDLFRETLTIPLQKRIFTLESPPTTFQDWCKWAIKLDHNWKKMQRVLGRTNQNNNKGKGQARKFYFQKKEKNPDAMDVDALSMDERTKLMKEGRCFTCQLTGHLSRDCPTKRQGKKNEESSKKTSPKELYAHIRACFKEMGEEEQSQFYKLAEESGF